MPLNFPTINLKKQLEKGDNPRKTTQLRATRLRFWFRVVVRVLVLGAALWAIVFALVDLVRHFYNSRAAIGG